MPRLAPLRRLRNPGGLLYRCGCSAHWVRDKPLIGRGCQRLGRSGSFAVHSRRTWRPRSRRDARETAGGGFRGSIQAPQLRDQARERVGIGQLDATKHRITSVRLPSDGRRRCAPFHSVCQEPILDARWYDADVSRMKETDAKALPVSFQWLQLHHSLCHP